MSKFLDELKEKIVDTAMILPYSEGTDRIVTIHCNKAFKNKLENELTNETLYVTGTANHGDFPAKMRICGIWVRLKVQEWNIKPKFKAGYYDTGNN